MKTLLKPAKLNTGDTIATITLSWGGAGLYPERYQIGKRRLEEIFGLHVVETAMPHGHRNGYIRTRKLALLT